MNENMNWPEFQKRTLDMQPRRMLAKVLEYYGDFSGYAVELGCGSGMDTVALAERGWKVFAVDSTPDGFENIMQKLPEDKRQNVECVKGNFEDIVLPEADLVYSSFSIPFCRAEAFASFWGEIVRAIKPGGRFAGNLFGDKDEWAGLPGVTVITKDMTDGLFSGFETEYFREFYSEGPAVLTASKMWHLFEIVAKKK
ncbi:MAG: class I SAM-dependent methyltransferase [Oscillospiraceae bacterium]|nr:class I SAM-dependent methyltransferase [Oscillospiraceae bacterium]